MEAKITARLRGRQYRGTLTATERSEMNQRIFEQCQKVITAAKPKRVMAFLPIERLNEIDTWPLVLWLWEKHRNKKVYVPRITGGKIEAIQITQRSTFISTKRGIPEPEDGPMLLPNESLDIVFIPLLGFDASGQRVGYGNGYFDRFLKQHPSSRFIGLGYECLFSKEGIASESHDIKLNAVITEDRKMEFGK